jgi:hypothetical protein
LESLRKPRRKGSFALAYSPMSTAPCPPLSTLHRAITNISLKSCRAAFPVRGSSNSSQHAANLFQSGLPRCDTSHQSVESIVAAPGNPRTICQWDFKCDSPVGEDKTIAWTAGGNERKLKEHDYLQQFAPKISTSLSRRRTTSCAIAACRSAGGTSSARSTGSKQKPVLPVHDAPVGPSQCTSPVARPRRPAGLCT